MLGPTAKSTQSPYMGSVSFGVARDIGGGLCSHRARGSSSSSSITLGGLFCSTVTLLGTTSHEPGSKSYEEAK